MESSGDDEPTERSDIGSESPFGSDDTGPSDCATEEDLREVVDFETTDILSTVGVSTEIQDLIREVRDAGCFYDPKRMDPVCAAIVGDRNILSSGLEQYATKAGTHAG